MTTLPDLPGEISTLRKLLKQLRNATLPRKMQLAEQSVEQLEATIVALAYHMAMLTDVVAEQDEYLQSLREAKIDEIIANIGGESE